MSPLDLSQLKSFLRALIETSPQGLSEHALLKQLREAYPDLFPAQLFKDHLTLYRAHFLLFHLLYLLRDELLVEQAGLLQIDVLTVRCLPYGAAGTQAIADADPMAGYYLDLGNMAQTTAEEVDTLLGDFWGRYYANSQRADALAVLGLCDPVDAECIQQRYRELAMKHHPDRGGETAVFARLQQAIALLRRC